VKAVRIYPDASGDGTTMRYEDIPEPVPSPRQVLIRIAAASMNRADILRRNFHGPGGEADPFTPGTDIAGIVEAVGEAVTEVQPGDLVAALLSSGGHAEKVVTHVAGTVPLPRDFDASVAAAVPVTYLTCWFPMMSESFGLKPGETALIQSGASGVGIAGIQIAKHIGARVFATAGSDAKVERLRALGVDTAINYTTTDFRAVVLEATGGRGVDYVLESVGGDVFTRSVEALAPGGRLWIVGNSSGAPEEPADPALVAQKNLTISRFALPSEIPTGGTRRELPRIFDLVAQGVLQPVIDRTFPLAEAAAAYEHLTGRHNVGKVLLIP